ncbi:hypothetical protein C8J56DRAFT_1158374 [Mycena floridula]|nr:hypothetical protein C8J56DRAFT_1158374 [Mycena floridula]
MLPEVAEVTVTVTETVTGPIITGPVTTTTQTMGKPWTTATPHEWIYTMRPWNRPREVVIRQYYPPQPTNSVQQYYECTHNQTELKVGLFVGGFGLGIFFLVIFAIFSLVKMRRMKRALKVAQVEPEELEGFSPGKAFSWFQRRGQAFGPIHLPKDKDVVRDSGDEELSEGFSTSKSLAWFQRGEEDTGPINLSKDKKDKDMVRDEPAVASSSALT